MSAHPLLAQLQRLGVELSVQGGRLRYRARKGTMTPELLAQLSSRKAELIQLLAGATPLPAFNGKPTARPGVNGHTSCVHSVQGSGEPLQLHRGPERNGITSCDLYLDQEAATRLPPVEAPPYLLVKDPAGVEMVATALDETPVVGLDLETTGLDPRTERVRLLSVLTDTVDGGRMVYVVDCFAVDPAPLCRLLSERELIAHNAIFDLSFLARLGFVPRARVHDTLLLSQLVYGTRKPRGFHGLEGCVERELGKRLDKKQQRSDWGGALTGEQLRYAAADAAVLVPLQEALAGKIRETGQEQAAGIEGRCLPAMVWLAGAGVPFDRGAWEELAAAATREADLLAQQLDAAAPRRPGHLALAGAWNWNSTADVTEALALVGCPVKATDDDTLAGIQHPLAELLRAYRSASKAASTYGTDWLKHVARDGRVYPSWRQVGCITGRMACGAPNLQNVPQGSHHQCFRTPPGRVLVKADYSQIELRIAAKVTGDRRMLDAYRNGEDLHTLTARKMVGREEVTTQERKLAKPVNFGLIYGLAAKSLRAKAKSEYGVEMSSEDADRYRQAFFATYPGIRAWHQRIRRERATETRTLAGRRAVVDAGGFFGAKANYAVQGTGGDGIKLALALLWERRGECPGAFPVLAVHDEIVVEADAGRAEAAAAWLKAAMVDGMAPLIDPVPVEVEVKTSRTWGGD
jgi:DNA polymerase-1